eukprot:TRINITY_DN11499_c0_g1_i1.p1 TRINITY_DN11499_c0_g1~~TRINITY_DN11499_c0_g1_i1.p1  ORF type:complete len:656 (-),score=80.95 TRINITY_DN11499_c0_g1_i1:2321-4288(-)
MTASKEPSSKNARSTPKRSTSKSSKKQRHARRKEANPSGGKPVQASSCAASTSEPTPHHQPSEPSKNGRNTHAAKAKDCAPPTPSEAPQSAPFESDLFEQPQHSFVSHASKITSKLFHALQNSREGVCDTHIHSRDNLCVAVSRSVLIALNPFLVHYACLDSSTTPQNCVANHVQRIPVSSHHLRHILEFTYTDDCEFIRNLRSAVLWRKDTEISPNAIVDVIQLAHAANVCHTPDLSIWCERTALAMVHRQKNFLCPALSTILNFCTPNAHHLINVWKSRLYEDPRQFLGNMPNVTTPLEAHTSPEALSCPVLNLDANALDIILKSCPGEEEYFFRALYCWATQGYTEFNRDRARWRNAVKLAHLMNFTKVSSTFLLGFVEGSGLVDQEDMSSIYRSHLIAKSNLPQNYGMQRTEERPLKRRRSSKGHETNQIKKKRPVDSGSRAATPVNANHAKPAASDNAILAKAAAPDNANHEPPPVTGTPTQGKRTHRSTAEQHKTRDGTSHNSSCLKPQRENITSVTIEDTPRPNGHVAVPRSVEEVSVLQDKIVGGQKATQRGSEQRAINKRSSNQPAKSLPLFREAREVPQQELQPPASEAHLSQCTSPAAQDGRRHGLQPVDALRHDCESSKRNLTEVKTEEQPQVVKEEMEIVEV